MYWLLQMQNYDNTADRAVGIVPDLIDKFADIFSKGKRRRVSNRKISFLYKKGLPGIDCTGDENEVSGCRCFFDFFLFFHR